MENQGRVDDPVVTLEFEEDAQKLSDFLRTEEQLEFAPSFDTSTDVYEMVQLRIKPLENGRAAFSVHPNSSMTESQLKTISSDAYQLYVQIKDKRHKQQSTIPQSNYYKITFKLPSQYGDTKKSVFGRLAPGRGRIVDKDQAIREFKQIVSYSLQTFRNDPKKGFEQHSLIYFPEPKKPHVVELLVSTPEEAERFLNAHESR